MKLKPVGENSTDLIPFLVICDVTLQLVVSGSFNLDKPASTSNVCVLLPQDNVTDPGDCMRTTAQR